MIELKAVNVSELLHDKPAPRIASFIFSAIFIALFACPAVFMIIGFFSAGNFSFYSLLFVIPVALILFRILKRAKNILPGPEWRVLTESETLRMGDTVSLQWNALKREAWAKSVRIDLERHEWAKNTSSSTTSYTEQTQTIPVAEGIEGYELTSGTRSFTLPAMMPPTFASDHNKVAWALVMTSQMKWQLPASRMFKVTILPPLVDETALPPEAADPTEPFSETSVAEGPLTLRTTGNRTHFVPGEEISGTVTWQCDRPDDRVELRLLWSTQGKGDKEETVVERLSLDAVRERAEFRLRLPSDGPSSFAGKFVAVVWALELAVMPSEAVQKERGFFQGKLKENTHRLELVVSPTGKELIYTPEPAYASAR